MGTPKVTSACPRDKGHASDSARYMARDYDESAWRGPFTLSQIEAALDSNLLRPYARLEARRLAEWDGDGEHELEGLGVFVRRARAEEIDQAPKRRLKLDPNLVDGHHWAIHDEPDATLMEIIRLWMDEALAGERIEIELVEMTDAEVQDLPDI